MNYYHEIEMFKKLKNRNEYYKQNNKIYTHKLTYLLFTSYLLSEQFPTDVLYHTRRLYDLLSVTLEPQASTSLLAEVLSVEPSQAPRPLASSQSTSSQPTASSQCQAKTSRMQVSRFTIFALTQYSVGPIISRFCLQILLSTLLKFCKKTKTFVRRSVRITVYGI